MATPEDYELIVKESKEVWWATTNEYDLEVSSPGVDRPLFEAAHYEKAQGEEVRVRTKLPQDGRRNFKGDLVAVSADMVTLKIDGNEHLIMISNIERANIIAKF